MKTNLDTSQFIGTEHYYKTLLKGVVYTDGMKYVADETKAYWLIDIVMSYQPKHKDKTFQLWKIEVDQEKNTAVVTAREDIGLEPFVRQKIGYTDFPVKEFEFYCCDGVIMVKSEY